MALTKIKTGSVSDSITLTAPTVNGGTHTAFTSTGIDDNATSTALTIDQNENVGVGVVPQTNWAGSVHDGDVIQVGTAGAVYGRGGGNLDMHVSSNLSRDSSGNFKTIATGASQFLQLSGGAYHFNSAASVSAGATATQTTKATIDGSGRLIIGGGITLGNGQTYSAANTIDDYEEGNWTPVIDAPSGSQPSIGYSVSYGVYTKVGRLVTISA